MDFFEIHGSCKGLGPFCELRFLCFPCSLSDQNVLKFTLRSTNLVMENGLFEDVFPIENGDNPASYVSLPDGIFRIL